MTEIVRNSLKERLARGEVASSMTVRLSRSVEIAQVAATAGFDSLYIDLEHSSLSLETTSQICCAALTCGIAPLVRVAQVELIQRVLDGGALGIIAPDVRTAAQAREVVRAAKYPPQGERGFASVCWRHEPRIVSVTGWPIGVPGRGGTNCCRAVEFVGLRCRASGLGFRRIERSGID